MKFICQRGPPLRICCDVTSVYVRATRLSPAGIQALKPSLIVTGSQLMGKWRRTEEDSDEDSYEVVDITDYARRHQWWSRVFGNNSGPIAEKYSVTTQLMMGGVTGWCAGYLFQRVGKIAATAIGGGFLLLQIANHSGYVQVDWKKVEKDVNKAKKHLKKKANKAAPEINSFIEESTEFVKKNIVLSGGFVGGFLLGLAS
ncbi:FUN14 domain-containing protein 1 isoform X1 [Erpetoichthys calabaricus]|uniref:FUN14 domain-containing protein 1 isoform X1 n=1 Tax=Erpetoichthys calabaricus TaxID=27687 RepID=UPI002234C466|nr:FUN14 domain-containing protein 1 isoform X1 [Erpetoichthys calabaricus]